MLPQISVLEAKSLQQSEQADRNVKEIEQRNESRYRAVLLKALPGRDSTWFYVHADPPRAVLSLVLRIGQTSLRHMSLIRDLHGVRPAAPARYSYCSRIHSSLRQRVRCSYRWWWQESLLAVLRMAVAPGCIRDQGVFEKEAFACLLRASAVTWGGPSLGRAAWAFPRIGTLPAHRPLQGRASTTSNVVALAPAPAPATARVFDML